MVNSSIRNVVYLEDQASRSVVAHHSSVDSCDVHEALRVDS